MIAVIYARVSSNSGRQDTERQVNELSAYARNNNIEVAKVFQDYVSGATPNVQRWVLQNRLKYCTEENTKVSCILMSEVSRLGRDTWEMIELVKFFHDYHFERVLYERNPFSCIIRMVQRTLSSRCSLLCSASLQRMREAQ